MRVRIIKQQCGAALVELLVAIALTGILLPALATALVAAHAGRATASQSLQATSLIREGQEAVHSVRESGWSNVSANGTYHPVVSGTAWTLVSGSETIGNFTRQVVIADVQRDTSGNVVTTGGTVDPSTKRVTVTVNWTTPTNGGLSTDTYLSRWQNNTVWSETTQADFTSGTLTNTGTTATGGVQLLDTPATWQLPSVFGSLNIAGNVAGNDVVVGTINTHNYAFVGFATGLAIINVDNPAVPVLTRTYTTTAAVNGVYVVGSTAYLATAITNAQFEIINLSDPATTAPTLTKSYQVQDNSNSAATSVFVVGTFAYVGKKQVTQGAFTTYGEFNVLNISNVNNITLSDNLNVAADINSVYVNGNFAYLATSRTNQQFTVVNVTTKTNITSAATVSLGAVGSDIAVNAAGTQAYVTTANNTGTELRVFTVSPTAATATAVGTGYEVGGAVNGVAIDTTNPSYLVLATSVAAKQAVIVNISTPTAITLVNNVTLGGNGNKVFVVGPYAYIGTADTAKELTVVYAGYRPSGTYESSTFDGTANVAYNYLNYTSATPTGTTLQFQVAANNTGSGWSYVGPDGTASTFYTAPGAIPLTLTSNRYIRYKTYLTTTNGQQTPVLSDVEVNYSP